MRETGLAMKTFELTFEKLSGLPIDVGAAAMAGSQKGRIASVKKELNCLSLNPGDLTISH